MILVHLRGLGIRLKVQVHRSMCWAALRGVVTIGLFFTPLVPPIGESLGIYEAGPGWYRYTGASISLESMPSLSSAQETGKIRRSNGGEREPPPLHFMVLWYTEEEGLVTG